jgi:hypothetical protein
LDNKVRIGYSVESLQRERPNPIRMVDDVARIQMKELLRSTLIVPPEEESKEQQQVCPEGCEGDIEGDGRSGSELQSVKGLKRVVRSPPRLLKRIEDNDNYIVKKSIDEYRHWDKVRKGPRHSRSKEDIKRTGKGLVEAHIVNKPNNYREARLRQALLGNKTLK